MVLAAHVRRPGSRCGLQSSADWEQLLADTFVTTLADGVSGISGAFAGLAEYYKAKQTKQDDCGLDLGWTHPGARLGSRSINNTALCERTIQSCQIITRSFRSSLILCPPFIPVLPVFVVYMMI